MQNSNSAARNCHKVVLFSNVGHLHVEALLVVASLDAENVSLKVSTWTDSESSFHWKFSLLNSFKEDTNFSTLNDASSPTCRRRKLWKLWKKEYEPPYFSDQNTAAYSAAASVLLAWKELFSSHYQKYIFTLKKRSTQPPCQCQPFISSLPSNSCLPLSLYWQLHPHSENKLQV